MTWKCQCGEENESFMSYCRECTRLHSGHGCVSDELARMKAERDELKAEIDGSAAEWNAGWEPIESAPRDGTEVLGWREDCGVLLVRFCCCADFLTSDEQEKYTEDALWSMDWFCADFREGSRLEGDEAPTHWTPLPEEPRDE